jgi:chromosome segregation protein
MRLSKVKLSGFKSFVDPTVLLLPGPIVSVVGPNGCGKSNVIDAVRWVLGESSARYLRGESMADVIFNGSSARKPVGQASVELVFDNGDGALGGAWAEYAEISVRRQVGRDGESQYFLNGTRCRRRDVTDLFLGTGLGPRSYAIIEQGTVSRVIEARPEELRLFIEEAAGISRYKERRRETEVRIHQTQENLARLNDLREELERQLQHLGRQAKGAERYKALKQKERRLRGELLTLRWRALRADGDAREREVSALETAHAASLAALRQTEAELEREREAHAQGAEALGEVQARFYAVSAEVARYDQSIEHARQRQTELRAEMARAERLLAEARAQQASDQAELARIDAEAGAEEPARDAAVQAEVLAGEALSVAEAALQDWQMRWDALNPRLLAAARAVDVERTRVHHLEPLLLRVAERAGRLEQERGGLAPEGLEAEAATVARELAEVERERAALEAAIAGARSRVAAQRDTDRHTASVLAEARGRQQSAQGRLAGLEAQQEQALDKRGPGVAEWLAAQGLAARPRLAEALRVEPGWERAVEAVLGDDLRAVCVEGLEGLTEAAAGLKGGKVTVFDTKAAGAPREGGEAVASDSLAARVEAPWSLGTLLAGVLTAPTRGAAEALRAGLGEGQSVVTPDGLWLGQDWLRVERPANGRAGLLAREQARRDGLAELQGLKGEVERLEAVHREGLEALAALEREQGALQARLGEHQRRQAGLQARAAERRARLEQVGRRARQVEEELREVARQRATAEADLEGARSRLAGGEVELQAHEEERAVLLSARDRHRSAVDEARQAWHRARDAAHAVAVALEGARARREGLDRGAERLRGQIAELSSRAENLGRGLRELEAPLAESMSARERALARQVAVEEELKGARRLLGELDERLRVLDRARRGAEERVEADRSRLEAVRLEQQTARVRLQEVSADLRELGAEPEEVLPGLPASATEADWQAEIEDVERRVTRLGPINLAAIEEFAEQGERKRYLDSQHADLVEALGTLDGAIRRMDRETRTRFRETFDRLNAGFRAMFPQLLGGGEASLELTGEDLLETGVSVVARPPGKRNSTIHLLSGGEKALTAIALVFSIFELNPAPFCMLDEVDAPLDDANVGRFCGLLRSMSERVQFILVTHNKTTMELADQLVGVTMHEPGVSRLVHVDVDQALQFAAV